MSVVPNLSVKTSIKTEHNANNQRVAKLINGTITEKYLWADLTTLLAVYDANDNLIQRFEYADQRMPVAMTDANGAKYYLHYDQVGSLRAVSDSNGNIIKEIVYDTYGNVLTDSNEAFNVPFGFAGGLYDPDTKLTRFGYRDYDAYTGKWTAKDPIGFAGGDSNLYGYVLNDPVNWIDHTGLESFDPLTGIPKDFMSPFYDWLDKTFGPKPPAPPSTFDKIYDGLSRDIPKMWDNAHPAAKMCLITAGGISAYPLAEAGVAYYNSNPQNVIDFINGFQNPQPLGKSKAENAGNLFRRFLESQF